MHNNTFMENLHISTVKIRQIYLYVLLDGTLKQKNVQFLTAIFKLTIWLSRYQQT